MLELGYNLCLIHTHRAFVPCAALLPLRLPKLVTSAATNMTVTVAMEYMRPDSISISGTVPRVMQLEGKGKSDAADVMASVGLQRGAVCGERPGVSGLTLGRSFDGHL
jgi:hypothetical protein